MKIIRTFLLTLILCTLLPLSGEARSAEFKIRPGDVLQITVWKEEGMDHELAVLPDGTVTFPLVGMVKLEGTTPSGAAAIIKGKLKGSIPNASVSVIVKAPLGHTVNVIGQVSKPGELVMTGNMTVMQALSQAGGLTPFADDNNINILRKRNGKEFSIDFPYDDIADGDHLEKNIDLEPGDVIVVPTEGLF